jgi:hypothetical protein
VLRLGFWAPRGNNQAELAANYPAMACAPQRSPPIYKTMAWVSPPPHPSPLCIARPVSRGGHFKTKTRTRIDRIIGLFGFSGSGSVPICAIFRVMGSGSVPKL